MGDSTTYRVTLTSGKRITVTRPNVERFNPDAITWDEKVYVVWGPESGAVLTS